MSNPSDEVANLEQRIADLEAEKASLIESARRTTHLSTAYANARSERDNLEADLAEIVAERDDLREQIAELTADRDKWKDYADRWYNWARHMLPEWFGRNGRLLKKPRRVKSTPNQEAGNSIVPETNKVEGDVAPEPADTQALPAVNQPSRVRGWATSAKGAAKKFKLPDLNG